MINFWEKMFADQGVLWDFYPSDSALIALDLFKNNKLKKILIPGVGYGRNAKPFYDNGFDINGIEISKSAIELAHQNNLNFKIHQGSLTDMPFDNETYDGIFCYATLHLFNRQERIKIIQECYKAIKPDGLMFFNVVSIDSIKNYNGTTLGKNTLKLENGLEVHFYTLHNIKEEFGNYNIIEISKIQEPIKHLKNQKPLDCFNIICQKN